MKLSLTTRTTAIISVVALVLVSVGTTTLSISFEGLENSQLATKQFQLVGLLDNVVLDLNRAEACEHEYILTQNRAVLDQYAQCFKQINENLTQLRKLLSDNTRYQMLLDNVEESISFRKSCAEEVLKQRDSSGMEAALERSKKFDEARLTQHVEWLAKDVSRTINKEMTDRFTALKEKSVQIMTGISVLLCSALLVMVVLIFGVNRFVQERYFSERTLREAQNALSEREARMRALVDTAPDGIITVRPSGKIESANAVFGEMMGCELTNIIERDIQNFIPGFLFEGIDAVSDKRDGKTELKPTGAVRELLAVRANGEKFPVEVSVSIVNLGKYNVFSGIVRDITERKEVEDKVKDFYSMVSHELRTPLASIRTALGIMENAAGEETPKSTLPVVKIAANEADRLMRLINDILDMRKVESGKLDLLMDVIDANFVVTRAIDGVKGLATEANLTITTKIDPGLELYCDEDRTLQVLTNFLANAIKFSPAGETILVECSSMGEKCRFAVTDHGPGVPKAQVHKLFGRFEQLRSTDGKQKPGSGLGLAIAKAIVEQHGGQIGVEQPDEGGSTFWFSLPLALDDDEDFEAESEEGDKTLTVSDRVNGDDPVSDSKTATTESGDSAIETSPIVAAGNISSDSAGAMTKRLSPVGRSAPASEKASKSSKSKKAKKNKG